MSRPTRHAALNARWLIADTQQIARSSPAASHFAAAFDSDDDDDDSFVPSSSKRQRTSTVPFSSSTSSSSLPSPPSSDPLPPPTPFTPSSSSPDAFDLWDESPHDPRHHHTRNTGVYVISPLYHVPTPFLDLSQAQAADAQSTPRPSNVLLPSGLTSASPLEPLSSVQGRDCALTEALATLEATFASAIGRLHKETFEAVGKWVEGVEVGGDRWALGTRVPTALLYCGVDVDDHPLLFSELSTHLTSPPKRKTDAGRCRCLPVQLTAASCGSVEKAVQQLLLTLMTTYPTSAAAPAVSLRSQASAHFLYSHQQHAVRQRHLIKDLWTHFAQWWEDTQADADGPLRLLLLITEPHAFDAAVLTGVLYVLLTHGVLSRLPWCWMFGLSVDGRVLRGLGERVVSRMKVTAFHLQSSASLLQPIWKTLLLQPEASMPLPLLGAEVMGWLMRDYAKAHTSLASWSRVLRAIACSYYANVEFSHMTQAWRAGKGRAFVAHLKVEELNELRRLVGEDGLGGGAAVGRGRRQLTFSDDEYREKLERWMGDLDMSRSLFVKGIYLLHALLVELVPGRVTPESLLIDAHLHLSQSGEAATFPPLVQLLQAVRTQPTSTVVRALQAMQSLFGEYGSSPNGEEVSVVIDALYAAEAAAVQQVTTARTASKPVKASNASGRRQAQLGGVVQADKAREAARANVATFLSAFFASRLESLTSLPLSSLFFFHSKELPSMFAFDQQTAVTAAITGGAPVESPLTAESDDMAVVFRLYQEANGVQLELHGWFQSFCSVVAQRTEEQEMDEKENGEEERSRGRKGKSNKRKGSKGEQLAEGGSGFLTSLGERQVHELFARFSVCVNALRWCGFVKPAPGKRAKEEMVRLVWDH